MRLPAASLTDFEAFSLIQYETSPSTAGDSPAGAASPLLLGSWGSSALSTALGAVTVVASAPSGAAAASWRDADDDVASASLLQQAAVQHQLRALTKKHLVLLRVADAPVALVDALLDRGLNLLLLLPAAADTQASGLESLSLADLGAGPRGASPETEPLEGTPSLAEGLRRHMQKLEQRLISRFSAGACLFAHETPQLTSLYEQLQEHQERALSSQALASPTASSSALPALLQRGVAPTLSIQRAPLPAWHPAAALASSRLTAAFHGRNIFAWLPGRRPENGGLPPAVAIVSHYDAFAAAPNLAFGTEENGSGVAALMELARIFSGLYTGSANESGAAASSQPGDYSLLFLLTDAGAADFAGAAQWLAKAEPRVLESISYVLCLDGIAASPQLRLHTPKKYKDPRARKLLQNLEKAFSMASLSLTVEPRKIIVRTPPKPFWIHEHFTMKKLIAGTLSSRADVTSLWARSSLLDRSPSPQSRENLARVVGALAEGLAHFVYDMDDFSVKIAEGSNRPLVPFLDAWLSLASRSPRFYAYRQAKKNRTDSTPSPSAAFADALHAWLGKFVPPAQSQTFTLPSSGTVFTYEPPMYLSVIETRPALFDVLCLLAALAYCFTVYYSIVGWHRLLPSISNLTTSVLSLFSSSGSASSATRKTV
ncbi:hypothetical protein BESB_010130 [Besnoitia besnoiti]|uniref:BOS complex subunit NCLN n=1 Tax=Besnoitia besnoiti TaxID=94643 RepID=A0A2A9MPN5_BESBE|nr:hypothetical protein BESB_010130 [Besnoitia besnoiti]PFH38671.1 hypothetical protein BESB_010130 [Besnoitia besnoiti]